MVDYEKFALFGFELAIPIGWSIAFDRKMDRQKGTVTFSDGEGNSIVVHWGPTIDAVKRFESLRDQRDFSLNQLRSGTNVIDVQIKEESEESYPQKTVLITKIIVTLKEGKWTRGSLIRYVFSGHIRCERSARYYVIYTHTEADDNFKDMNQIFDYVISSFNTWAISKVD